MPNKIFRSGSLWRSLPCAIGVFIALSCGPGERSLAPRFQTFGELRAVRGDVTITPPGSSRRALYPRERLVDGAVVEVPEAAVAWLRRDGGTAILLRGPAHLTFRAQSIQVDDGKLFVDSPSEVISVIETPEGPLHLQRVRASLDVSSKEKTTDAYVLSGEVRTEDGTNAEPGELLSLSGAQGAVKATKTPAVAFQDWTGGLATTDKAAEPPPFGVGTVGARKPGDQGAPRFPLAIQKMDVRVVIDGDLAITEVDETFFNAASETVEGMYVFRTPEGATLGRFGVDRDGAIAWGHVKEKAAAAAQYKANVYAGSTEDPALLEWDSPGVYRARLYPIGPGEARRVIVRYTEWLPRSGPKGERRLYVFPMAAEGAESSLPHIEFFGATFDLSRAAALEVRAGMAGAKVGSDVVVRAHDLVPRADLAIELYDAGISAGHAYRAHHVPDLEVLPPSERSRAQKRAEEEKDYIVVPIRAADVPRVPGGLDLVILVDTSAATDPTAIAISRAAVNAMLAHLSPEDRVALWAGDTALRPVVDGWSGFRKIDDQARHDATTGLANLERGGATDLGGMIAQAALQLDPSRRSAVVYIGDGRPTVGELGTADLQDKLAKLARPVRIFGFGVGEGANLAVLSGIAKGGFAERVGDAAAATRAALRLLEVADRPAWLGVSVDLGTGVERVYPRDLSALANDDTVFLVGRLVGTPPAKAEVRTSVGTTTQPIDVRSIEDSGDLRGRWANGRLAQMLDQGTGRAALVDVGVRYGIITPVTSLYVPTTKEMSPEEREELDRRKRQKVGTIFQVDEARVAAVLAAPLTVGGCSRSFSTESESAGPTEHAADSKEGGRGTRAKGEEGSMGNPSGRRDAVEASGAAPPAPEPPAATKAATASAPSAADREVAKSKAAEFGMIGLLSQSDGDKNSPTTPWGRDDANAARGNMWGGETGDAFGAGGLAGIGEGGGGSGEGIGLGSIGTLGHGAGTGTGQGFGSGHGRLGGPAATRAVPQLRQGTLATGAGLPPEVIQRILRQNWGRFRLCYESGLRNNPNLQGRVNVGFVIGRDGAVSNVANSGSDLPDASVTQCVVRSVSGLTFPQPEAESVRVTYPIVFAPDDQSMAHLKPATPDPQKPSSDKSQPNNAPASATHVSVNVTIDGLPHAPQRCAGGASLPFEERVQLWTERLGRVRGSTSGVATEYRRAIALCEAPTWRERGKLLSLMLDAMPTITGKVELWRRMSPSTGEGDALYRDILARVHTATDVRELHQALGLKTIDPTLLAKALGEAKTAAEKVGKLRVFVSHFPDDLTLALKLLDTLEDAQDDGGARELARKLRARPDANAHIRTEVGELYLRLSTRAKTKEQAEADVAEARRAFGEMVELSPDEPIARRRLGDLLRAHGWFAEAARQYETLARLAPDDLTVSVLLASTAEGQGKLEEAVRWAEKASASGAPDEARGLARTARSLAATYLAWGRLAALREDKGDEVNVLRARTRRILPKGADSANSTRVSLTWSHPELHPTLWSNALSVMTPAPEGDATLGIAQVMLPKRAGAAVEIRMEPEDAEHAARLGAEAILTEVFDEGAENERIVRVPIRFRRSGPATIKLAVENGEVH